MEALSELWIAKKSRDGVITGPVIDTNVIEYSFDWLVSLVQIGMLDAINFIT